MRGDAGNPDLEDCGKSGRGSDWDSGGRGGGGIRVERIGN